MAKKAPRLLIVDDEADTCANLSDIFTDLGYATDVAYDGTTAIALVEQNNYDVAILDLKMPGMDGLELYRRIRQISAGTVAIVVTAYASSSTAASVLDAGAWKILPKPVDLPQLFKLVGEVLDQPLVLLVDDDQDLCDSLWDVFRKEGYRVSLAHDVPEALSQLTQLAFEVVVADIKLPSGQGTKVLESVHRANPQARSVIITGFRGETETLVRDALTKGVNAVCYKPFNVEHLLSTIRQLCDTDQAGKAIASS